MDQLPLPARPFYLCNIKCDLSLLDRGISQSDVGQSISPCELDLQPLVRLDKMSNKMLRKYNMYDTGERMVSSPTEHRTLSDLSLENKENFESDVEKSISHGAFGHQPLVRLEKMPKKQLRKYTTCDTGEGVVSSITKQPILSELSLENKGNSQPQSKKSLSGDAFGGQPFVSISHGAFEHQPLVRLEKMPNKQLRKYTICGAGERMVSSITKQQIVSELSLENKGNSRPDAKKSISRGSFGRQPLVRIEKIPNILLRKYNIYNTGEKMVSSTAEHSILIARKDKSPGFKSCHIDYQPQPVINIRKFHRRSELSGSVCKFCAKGFKRLYDLERHMCRFRSEVEALRFECDLCGKMFRNLSMLKFHKAGHQSDSPHDCAFCGMKFKTVKSAQIHRKTHCTENRLFYGQCDKQIKNCQILQKSKTTALCTDNAPKCKNCGISFHTRNDKVEKDLLLCQLCKSPEAQSDYAEDVENDPCRETRICGDVGPRDVRLKRPTRRGQRQSCETPFRCFLCDKTFILSISLHSHMMAHYSKRQLIK